MKLLLSSVVFDLPLREGDITQAGLIDLAEVYGLAGLELRDAYWLGEETELETTKSQLWAGDYDVVYATGDILLAESLAASLTALENMLRNITVAAKIGARILRINPGLMEHAAIFEEQAYRELMARVEEESRELGITLALENPPQTEAGSIMVLNRVFIQFPFIKMTFDTGNWQPAGEDPLAALDVHMKRVAYVHLKDVVKEGDTWRFCAPGSGTVPFKKIIAKLTKANYAGYFALEFNGGADPAANLTAALQYVRGIVGNGE